MTFNSVDEAAQSLTAANDTFASYNSAEKDHRTTWAGQVRHRRCAMLASLFGLSQRLVAAPKILAELCVRENVAPPKEGENPFAAAVRLVCRTKNKEGKWVDATASTWIFTKYFRMADKLGWTAENFADRVEGFVHEKGKKKTKWLAGLALRDTETFGKDSATAERLERLALAWIASQTSDAVLTGDIGLEKVEHGQMASVVVQWNAEASVWMFRGIGQKHHDRAWASVSKDIVKSYDTERELDTERPPGMGYGRIPISKIEAYAAKPIYDLTEDEQFAFKEIIKYVDIHYIDLRNKASEAASKAQAKPR